MDNRDCVDVETEVAADNLVSTLAMHRFMYPSSNEDLRNYDCAVFRASMQPHESGLPRLPRHSFGVRLPPLTPEDEANGYGPGSLCAYDQAIYHAIFVHEVVPAEDESVKQRRRVLFPQTVGENP